VGETFLLVQAATKSQSRTNKVVGSGWVERLSGITSSNAVTYKQVLWLFLKLIWVREHVTEALPV
jgi:hypothetical protein